MELWRTVPGYDGRYDVSNRGRVRGSVGRHGVWAGGPRVLRPGVAKTGHLHVTLCKEGGKKIVSVHRLVASAFLGESDMPVLHKDGDPRNNCPENLYYGSHKENAADRSKHGRTVVGERHHASKLTESQVQAIKANLRIGGVTTKEVAAAFHVSVPAVQHVRSGETWTHLAY